MGGLGGNMNDVSSRHVVTRTSIDGGTRHIPLRLGIIATQRFRIEESSAYDKRAAPTFDDPQVNIMGVEFGSPSSNPMNEANPMVAVIT